MPTVRLDHIALALPHMADAVPVLCGILGGRPSFGAASRVYRFGQWEFDGSGRLEVLEPTDPGGFLARFLDRHGPGVHHVTFKVKSLAKACARAETQGYQIVGRDESDPEWKEAFLHPKQALGVVVQLAQFDPSEAPQPAPRWEPPAVVADPPPPVTIVGLRLSAHTHERARSQWHGLLEAEQTEARDGTLVYRWPASPLRLAVEVDATRPEGPLVIEYTTARPVALTPQAIKTVGVGFVNAG